MTVLPQDKMNYLVSIYKEYLTHLNSVFNYFIVFSGLVISGIGLLVRSGANTGSLIDEAFLVIGILFSFLIFMIDRRSRSVIHHIEKKMLEIEKVYFGAEESSSGYLKGIPSPKFFFSKNRFLFPTAFFAQIIFLLVLFPLI